MAFVMIPTNLKDIVNHPTQSIVPMIERRELMSVEAEAAIHKDRAIALESNCFLGLLPGERKQIHLLGHSDLDISDLASAVRLGYYLVHICCLPEDTRVVKFNTSHFISDHRDGLQQYLQVLATYLQEQGYYARVACDDEIVKAKRSDEQIETLLGAIDVLESDIAVPSLRRSLFSLFKSAQADPDNAEDDDIQEEAFFLPPSTLH